jgi:DNA-binding GntR family transcriptional regulator
MFRGHLTASRPIHTVCCMQPATELRAEFKTREQATYEALRRAIIQGRWSETDLLVVSRLATELGVSRITVANALKRLSGEGFVKLTPHKEAMVAPIESADIRQIYLMRAELEALSAREAAQRVEERDLIDLEALNREMGSLIDAPEMDFRAIRAVDLAFHRRLREIAVMPRLAQTLENLADQCEGYRARLLDSNQIAMPSVDRHQPVIHALASHDSELAAVRMRFHVIEGMEAIFAMLERP